MRRVQGYFEDGGGRRSTLVTLEVASTPEERARGLMHRAALAPSTGMLFAFSDEDHHSMWMKNTFIPLDLLWLDAKGRVVDSAHLKPHDTSQVGSIVPAKFAIELPRGWMAAHNVVEGPGGSLIRTTFDFKLVRKNLAV